MADSTHGMSPNRPYLLRALYSWIVDNGLTPQILVNAEIGGVSVPSQVIKQGKVVLNVGPNAVQELDIGNEWLLCSARFSGKSSAIELPVPSIMAIYARENGQGMMFAEEPLGTDPPSGNSDKPEPEKGSHLSVVK